MSGDLPKNWILSTLGDVCLKPQYGWTTKSVKTGLLHIIRTTDITSGIINWDTVPFCENEPENKGKYLLKDGDILISRAGSVGYSLLIKSPPHSVFASYLIRFMPLINRNFLSYFLKSPYFWNSISKSKIGIAVPNVNATKLKQISIPIAPLNEQHRIVAKLEELFTKLDVGVEALKQVQAKLKLYRQSVLKAAVEGRLTAEWREQHKDELEPADILLERIQEDMKKKLKKKHLAARSVGTINLPELPKKWVYTTIKSISEDIHYGYTASSSSEYIGPKLLRITDIQNRKVNWTSVPHCNIDSKLRNKYLLKTGDLVFTRTGATVGKSYLIRDDVPEAVFASYLIRVIIHKQVNKDFVYSYFQTPQYWVQIAKKQLGIGQPNINASTLSNLVIPLPPAQEQEAINREIDRLLSIVDEVNLFIESEIKRAQALRQSILKRAFEGKLVPQDPNDEPASILLEKIKAEKAKSKKTNQLEMF